jgi:hypothetical protein
MCFCYSEADSSHRALHSPSVKVLRDFKAKNKLPLEFGFGADGKAVTRSFEAIRPVIELIMKKQDIPFGTCPSMVAFDEVVVEQELSYDSKTSCIIGFCGEEVPASGGPHVCTGLPVEFIPHGPDHLGQLQNIISTRRQGQCKLPCLHYNRTLFSCNLKYFTTIIFPDATVGVLNPMRSGVPKFVCYYGITCNSTTAAQAAADLSRVLSSYQEAGLRELAG